MPTNKVEKKNLTTTRQRELLRVIDEAFKNFAERGQPYYGLEGMSTSHILVHAVQDFKTLKEFWPAELVKVQRGYYTGDTTTYLLQDDTLEKAQSAVRSTLVQLQEKGWIERLGNENERRWRPVREDKPKTREVFDKNGVKIGTQVEEDGKWVMK